MNGTVSDVCRETDNLPNHSNDFIKQDTENDEANKQKGG